MISPNYKLLDTRRILSYLSAAYPNALEVEDIVRNGGAERLRVYPILFELEQEGRVEVLERELLGAPKVVRLKDRPSAEGGQEI